MLIAYHKPALFKVPLVNHTYELELSIWLRKRDRNKGERKERGQRVGERSREETPTSWNGKDNDVCSLLYREEKHKDRGTHSQREATPRKRSSRGWNHRTDLRMMSFKKFCCFYITESINVDITS